MLSPRIACLAAGRPGFKHLGGLLIAFALLFLGQTASWPAIDSQLAAAADPVCATSQPEPTKGYTVQICLTAPADGATLTGDTLVSATVSVSGTGSPGISSVLFYVDRTSSIGPALTSFAGSSQTVFQFRLPTTFWVDGAHTIDAAAQMKATTQTGPQSAPTSVNVTFGNGVTQPPAISNTFVPTSATGSSVTIAAVGDGADGKGFDASVANMVASWDPSIFLYLGDVYQDGRYAEFTNGYDPSFGRLRGITNPTIGNHEYEAGDISGYSTYWDTTRHYYSFDAGSWHVINLDSNSQYGQLAPGTGQYDWLVNELNSHTNDCTLVYYHHPLFNIGPEGNATQMSAVWQLLASKGVDIVLNGHDHNYQRWAPLDGNGNPSQTGITEFVVGTGGHGVQQIVPNSDPRVLVRADANGTFGALRLTLNPGGASYQMAKVGGPVLDSGSVSCNGAADTTAPTAPTNLTGAAVSGTRLDLSWTASTDDVGVSSYNVYRDGNLVGNSGSTSYSDTTVKSGETHTYQVQARDAAGNLSPMSDQVSLSTGPLFVDGFESGTMGQWQTVPAPSLVVQSGAGNNGTFGAVANSTGSNTSFAYAKLDAQQNELYYRIRFKLNALPARGSAITLLGVRTDGGNTNGDSIVSLFVNGNGNLALSSVTCGTGTNSRCTQSVSTGAWHEVQFHIRLSDRQQDVWYDGTLLSLLGGPGNFVSTTPIGRIQLGTNTTNPISAVFDDVVVSTTQIPSDFTGDATPPGSPALAITAGGTNQFASGSTVYYNPSAGNSGTFTVNASTSDPQSGIANVTFPAVFGSDGGPDTTPPYSQVYNWDSNATASGSQTVTATNGSGLTSTSTFRVLPDIASPSSFALAGLTDGSTVHNGTPLAASLSDSGSGIAGITFAYCSSAPCDWASATIIGSDTAAPYTLPWFGQPAEGTYVLIARATDRVGNTTDAAPISVIIDNTAPTGGITAPQPQSVVRSGVTLSTDASDSSSGVASVRYQFAAHGSNVWTDIASATAAPFDAQWIPGRTVTDGSYDLRAIITDRAGNSVTSQLITVNLDISAPTVAFTDPGANLRGIVTLSATANDSNGVGSVAFEYSAAGANIWSAIGTVTQPADPAFPNVYTTPFDTTSLADAKYDLRVTVTDSSGNTRSVVLQSKRVDNTLPVGTIQQPAAGSSWSSTVTVTASGSDTNGSGTASVKVQYAPSGTGTWIDVGPASPSPFSATWNVSALAEGPYDLQVITTDNAGNVATSAPRTVFVDRAAPSGSITAPASGTVVRGTVNVTSDSSDSGSGVANAVFQYAPAGSGAWTTIATDTSSPYSVNWVTTNLTEGLYDLRVITTDRAGNAFTSNTVTVTFDGTAAAVTFSDPGRFLRGTVSFTATATDSNGITSVSFQRATPGTQVWTTMATATSPSAADTYTAQFDTTTLADGQYDMRALVLDRAGNTSASTSFSRVRIDNSAPSGALLAPAAGSFLRNSVTVTANSSDGGSGVASALFQIRPTGTSSWTDIGSATSGPFGVTWDTTLATDGQYDLQVITTDNAGNATVSAPVTVTVDNTAPGTAPALTATAGGSGTAVSLAWSAATDVNGIVAYDVYRDGALLTTVGSSTLSYSDNSVISNTTYSYQVAARDAAGNATTSNTAPATTGTRGFLFTEGFESGNLGQWTSVSGLVVQQSEVYAGTFAARGTASGTATVAYHPTGDQNDLYVRVRFKIVSQGANTVTLFKLRTGAGTTGTSIAGLYVDSNGRLGLRNDMAAVSVTSSAIAAQGVWHEVEFRARINSPMTEVWFDGSQVPSLTRSDTLGATPIGRIQLGENQTGRTYDVAFDDVAADSSFIALGSANPTATPIPTATSTAIPTATGTPTTAPTPTLTPTPTVAPASLSPVADAQVLASNPSTNYGSGRDLTVSGGSASAESYLKFTVNTSQPIVKAVLRMTATDGSSAGPSVYAAPSTWTETGLTWSNRPSRTSIVAPGPGAVGKNAIVDYDVTGLITGNGTYTVVFVSSSTDNTIFASKEAPGGKQARLILTLGSGSVATPTPTATPTNTPSPTVAPTGSPTPNGTSTPTATSVPSATSTATAAATATAAPPTATATQTPVPTATNTPTATAVPPTATATASPPPTATSTPAPISLGAAADAEVRESTPSGNFGASSDLGVVAGNGTESRSYIRFDVSGVSGAVQHATLRLVATNGTTQGPSVWVAGTSVWSETSITWGNMPALGSAALAPSPGGIAKNATVDYDVTGAVTAAMAGNRVVSLALITTSTDNTIFSSKDGPPGKRPVLILTLTASGAAAPLAPQNVLVQVTEIPTPSPTLVPTSTSVPPTQTPVPPTPTPVPPSPTATPEPPTPTPELTTPTPEAPMPAASPPGTGNG